MKRNWLVIYGLVALICLVNAANAFSKRKLAINAHKFDVEVAQTMQELQQGLMFREKLAQNAGMLFVNNSPRTLSMWMKNTLIDLDMIFIAENGKIIAIHTAIAGDLAQIKSPAPAKYVLEINAGIAKKLAIKVGDVVDLNN